MKRPYARSSGSVFSCGRIPDDDGLAAPVVQSREGVLVGHGGREPQRVGEGLVFAAIGIEAGAAQGGPQGRGIDGDDGLQPGPGVLAEGDLLMAGPFGAAYALVRRREHMRHCGDSSGCARALARAGSAPQLRGPRAAAGGLLRRPPFAQSDFLVCRISRAYGVVMSSDDVVIALASFRGLWYVTMRLCCLTPRIFGSTSRCQRSRSQSCHAGWLMPHLPPARGGDARCRRSTPKRSAGSPPSRRSWTGAARAGTHTSGGRTASPTCVPGRPGCGRGSRSATCAQPSGRRWPGKGTARGRVSQLTARHSPPIYGPVFR